MRRPVRHMMSAAVARLMPVMGRQSVQETLDLAIRPVMRNFHGGRIHLDKLCQKGTALAVSPRTTARARERKMAELGAKSAIGGNQKFSGSIVVDCYPLTWSESRSMSKTTWVMCHSAISSGMGRTAISKWPSTSVSVKVAEV